jgi:tryptophanase
MRSEPFKIKEVKKMTALRPYERWNILKQAHFNTFHVCSDHVAFDMVARGMSAWSHFQKAGLMIGDEAYAGARSFLRLESAVQEVLGIEHLVPTHNGIGSEKLLAATMIQPGQTVLHNRGRCEGLVLANKGKSVDVSVKEAGKYGEPQKFGGNVGLAKLERLLKKLGKNGVAYIQIDTCPDAWNGQPVSLANIEAVK